ncbi:hypothetical protein CBOM_01042 [Ceraceosorus bombacis]|uniref:Arylsulfotransferase n=1 Tax=Ceraceosorus bombacis TaxID=401625 RepID=A0A0P1BAL6_9BASI|nr:hypothetical protein CBOM_01042 [Ceraceosorus bombacis]
MTLSASSTCTATWQFLSRPDLNVPILNITHNTPSASQLSPGLLFISPFSGDSDHDELASPPQPGPYIFEPHSGQLVWSGFAQYTAGWTVSLHKTRFKGKDALLAFEGKHNALHGHGHGHLTLLDQSYGLIKSVGAGHHRLVDKHEAQVIADGASALVQIYHPVPGYGLQQSAGEGGEEGGEGGEEGEEGEQHDHVHRQWVVDAQFQEVDVQTGRTLFEWHSLDHVPVHHSNISLVGGQAGNGTSSQQAWDYFHINSVDKDRHGDYLISARDVNSVYKISGKTGRIIWALGGRNTHNKDFEHLDDQVAFSYQHHAKFHGYDHNGRQLISLYDNSAHGTETGAGTEVRDAKTSSGKIIALDTSADRSKGGKWTARTWRAFYPPFDLLSKSQGSTHLLQDGHVVVNWGSEGAVTEFNDAGEVLWHAFLASNSHHPEAARDGHVQNYRAFKSTWSGHPAEEPAVVGLAYRSDEDGKLLPFKARGNARGAAPLKAHIVLAASWNGDTEVRAWKFQRRRKPAHETRTWSDWSFIASSIKRLEGWRGVHHLATKPRSGFETRAVVGVESVGLASELHKHQIRAIALDARGRTLTVTRWEDIDTQRPVPPQLQEIDAAGDATAFVVQTAHH